MTLVQIVWARKLILYLLSVILVACSKEDSASLTDSIPAKVFNEETLAFHEFTKQLYGNKISDAVILETSTKLPNQHGASLLTNFNSERESIGDFYIRVNSNTIEGIVELRSSTYLSEDSDDTYVSYVSLTNETGFEVYYMAEFKDIGNDRIEILSLEITDGNNESQVVIRGWFSDYADCVKGVISTDDAPGAIITVMGVAGGVGCVPCGGVAAFILGVGAVGCLGV